MPFDTYPHARTNYRTWECSHRPKDSNKQLNKKSNIAEKDYPSHFYGIESNNRYFIQTTDIKPKLVVATIRSIVVGMTHFVLIAFWLRADMESWRTILRYALQARFHHPRGIVLI